MNIKSHSKQKRFAPKLKIKTGDRVLVIAGNEKGTEGDVLKVLPEENRVIVEGVRIVKRHYKAQNGNPGRVEDKYQSIHLSNVKLIDPTTGTPTRVGRRLEDDKIVRFAKNSNQTLEK